jgi:hypothetical protein
MMRLQKELVYAMLSGIVARSCAPGRYSGDKTAALVVGREAVERTVETREASTTASGPYTAG